MTTISFTILGAAIVFCIGLAIGYAIGAFDTNNSNAGERTVSRQDLIAEMFWQNVDGDISDYEVVMRDFETAMYNMGFKDRDEEETPSQ